MREVKILPAGALGHDFIPAEFLPEGRDENYLRNEQVGKDDEAWRHLRSDEIEALVKNGVTCSDWDRVYVSDPFTPHLVKNCEFSGLIRIGRLEDVVLEHHELRVPAGITNSLVIACDLGDNVAVHNVRYLSHYIIGDNTMLLSIDEMNTTNHAKFGNGIVKDGEPEEARIWLDLMNEAGGRAVMPFDGMTAADAFLWAKFRDDTRLQERLKQITEDQFDSRRGFFGVVGDAVVVKNSRILKDVKIGPSCYIKGANKLKNLTINSSVDEPTQIGEGVELVNGIIGLGCRIFYGVKAVRFVMANNTNLKYGARLINSYLGDNSTVSCCEILNNLVFPGHEQHHNNSFLIAALVMGQSNIAAGATIGSNHNSRSNDGEIQAGRGFWPGLCTTLKHSSRFASFVLLTKGDYAAELNVPLPFSLVSNDVPNQQLLLMPAYWWNFNMYALARNTWKYRSRDRRRTKTQNIEFDVLAPDTAEEIIHGLSLLEIWTAKAYLSKQQQHSDRDEMTLAKLGRQQLSESTEAVSGLEILGEGIEHSTRKVVISRIGPAYRAYREMLHYYAMTNLLEYLRDHPQMTYASLNEAFAGPREHPWMNLGGQIVLAKDVEQLKSNIKSGKLNSWDEIHRELDRLWAEYPLAKQRHAFATLLTILGTACLTRDEWNAALDEAVRIQEYICEQVYVTRKKDHENRFRQATFENTTEMESVIGTAEQNAFVKHVRDATATFKQLVESVRRR
jgi:hypothetical protein